VHVALEPEALHQGMVQSGPPGFVADAMVVFDVAARHGYHAVVAPTVKELTGREPVPVREFLAQHQAALMPGE
jgi:NAD(P)H dehydrogenase (quinone)